MSAPLFATMLIYLVVAGCNSVSADRQVELGYAAPKRIDICHGYGCKYRSKLHLGTNDGEKFRRILSAGAASPAAERAAISQAVRYFDERVSQTTGARDNPRAAFADASIKGQMDCIDESTNTHALLLYLSERGLLRHHKVERNTSRGFFFDGRYPHATAVISDPAGVKWVVDSWYSSVGGAPDIILLSEWTPRGFLASGALDS